MTSNDSSKQADNQAYRRFRLPVRFVASQLSLWRFHLFICQGTWHVVIIHSHSNVKKQYSLDTFYSVAWTVRLVIDWSYVIPVVSPHKLVEIPLRAVQTSFDYQAFLLPAPHRAGTKYLFQKNVLKNTPRRHFSQAQWTYFGFSFRRSSCDLVIRTMNILLKG